MGEHATEEACPQGCVPPPTLTPQGHSAAGSGAGRGLEATWSVFSSLVDGHRDRAPSLLLLGAERARPGLGVGAPLPPLSGLQPRSPISPLSVCLSPQHLPFPLYPSSSFTLLPFPHLLTQLPAGGQVTLFPVALLCTPETPTPRATRMGDSVTGRHSRAGPAKRPSPEGGGGQHAVSAGSQTLAARPALPQADDITGWLSLVKCRGDVWPASLGHIASRLGCAVPCPLGEHEGAGPRPPPRPDGPPAWGSV